MENERAGDLVVLRCQTCGDTFTADRGAEHRCPSCGGSSLDVAHEPLL